MDDRDLEQRLAGYRPVVERSMARRPVTPGGGRDRRRWVVSAVAAATVAAGVVGWVALGGDEPSSTGTVATTEADVIEAIACRLRRDEPTNSPAEPTESDGTGVDVDFTCLTALCVTDGDVVEVVDPETLYVIGTIPQVSIATPVPLPEMVGELSARECIAVGRPETVAFGDSIMLGAASPLSDAGITVDAQASRQLSDLVATLSNPAASAAMDVAVIHVGNNGTIDPSDLSALFTSLAAVPRVVVLTLHGDAEWFDANNDLIRALPAEYPNVIVLDWDALAEHCAGECFASDGFHLTADGADYYTALITNVLGMSTD